MAMSPTLFLFLPQERGSRRVASQTHRVQSGGPLRGPSLGGDQGRYGRPRPSGQSASPHRGRIEPRWVGVENDIPYSS